MTDDFEHRYVPPRIRGGLPAVSYLADDRSVRTALQELEQQLVDVVWREIHGAGLDEVGGVVHPAQQLRRDLRAGTQLREARGQAEFGDEGRRRARDGRTMTCDGRRLAKNCRDGAALRY